MSLGKKVTGLFLKSEGVEAEIAEARKAWRFTYDVSPSASDSRGRIVKVEGLARG